MGGEGRMVTMARLKTSINLLVYLSVMLGVGLFVQIIGLLPQFVFYSIVAGWLAYLVTAVVVATGRDSVYPVVLALAVLTLAVSLPQPAHYAFVTSGETLAALTFIAGSVLQVCLIVLIPLYLIRKRRRA